MQRACVSRSVVLSLPVHCVVGAGDAVTRDARTDEMMAAVGRPMRRG